MIRKILSGSANLFVKMVGIFLFLFSILSIIIGISGLKASIDQSVFGFSFELSKDKQSLEITRVTNNFPAQQAGLQVGDHIISVEQNTITEQNNKTIFLNVTDKDQITLKVKRGDQEMEIKMARRLLPLMDRVIRVLYLLILPLLMMAYTFVGLWGIFKNPSFITNLIALVCFSFGILAQAAMVTQTVSRLAEIFHYFPIKAVVTSLGIEFAPAFWLLLFVIFPKKAKFYTKHKVLTIFLIFLPSLAMTTLDFLAPKVMDNSRYTLLIYIVFLSSYIYAGVVILAKGARKEKNILTKRQYQLMLLGIRYGTISIFFGFFTLILFQYISKLLPGYFLLISLIIFLISQIIGLIIPFTFLNSFFHHKILETKSALKRRLMYIISSFSLFFIYLTIAFMLGNWIISKFKLTDPSIIIIIILVLSLSFSPLHSRLLTWLERKLYPEKTKYKSLLKELTTRMAGFIEENQILSNLTNWISETMNINPVYAFSITNSNITIPLKVESKKSVLAKTRDGSNFFWDELSEETQPVINEDEQQWAHENGISISIPLISRGEQVGILNIGKKKNKQDFTGDDLEIFREAAFHSALAIQNVKLQSEHLEKKRLDRELEVARNIQAHLMPAEIPDIKGLQVYGGNIPCFEVGGDYFDIIPISDSKTMLTIADVRGKGAGAALLMSNLQASLKMAVAVNLPLVETVYKINNLIYRNSLAFQFITFFLAIWDSKEQKLAYINAGHNPPFITRTHNRVKKLAPTGIGLGIRENKKYRLKKESLTKGDTLTIYTDGIEEFFNEQLEPYGLERMINTLKKNRDQHPRQQVESLLQDLKDFSPDSIFSDDVTIIVAKVE